MKMEPVEHIWKVKMNVVDEIEPRIGDVRQ